MLKFEVVKRFTDGALMGLTVTETTGVQFAVGEVVTSGPWTGSGYEVVSVRRVEVSA